MDAAGDLVKEIIGGAGGDDLVVTSVSFTAPDKLRRSQQRMKLRSI